MKTQQKTQATQARRFRARGARTPLALDPRAADLEFDAIETDETETQDSGIAVVTVRGPLEHHCSWWWDSYDQITERVQSALDDAATKAVVMQFDSPGGNASGMVEAAKRLRELAHEARKPLFAYVNEQCASAAYGLACAADEIWLPPTGEAGSVGVYADVCDLVAANEKQGINAHVLTSGKRKADGHPDKPLDDDVLEALQGKVDEYAAAFFELVGAARGMSPAKVQKLEAATFLGQKAVDAGLADGIASWPEFLGMVAEALGIDYPGRDSGDSVADRAADSEREARKAQAMTKLQLAKAKATLIEALEKAKSDEDRKAAIKAYESALKKKYKRVEETESEEESEDAEEAEDAEDAEEAEEESEDAEDAEDAEEAEDDEESEDAEDDEDEDEDEEDDEDEEESKKALSSKRGAFTYARLYRLAREVTGKRGVKSVFAALRKLSAATDQVRDLRAEVKQLQATHRNEQISAILSRAQREGRITPATARTLRGERRSPQALKALIETMPKRVRSLEDGAIGSPDLNAGDPLAGLSQDQRKLVEQRAAMQGRAASEVADELVKNHKAQQEGRRY